VKILDVLLRLNHSLVTLLLLRLVGEPPNNIGIDACSAATPYPSLKKWEETNLVVVVIDSSVVVIVTHLAYIHSHKS
jgi:hypothetical protein